MLLEYGINLGLIVAVLVLVVLAAVHGTLNFGVGNVQQRNTNDNRHYTESTIPSITISSDYYSGSVGIHTKEPNEPFIVTSNNAPAFVV